MKHTKKRNNLELIVLMLFLVYSVICKYLQARGGDTGGVFLQYMLQIESSIAFYFIFRAFFMRFTLTNESKQWILSVLCYVLLDTLNTLLHSPTYIYILPKLVYWIMFAAFFYLGKKILYWEYLKKTLIAILFISVALSALELLTSGFNYVLSLRGMGDDSYLYDIQIGFCSVSFCLIYCVFTGTKTEKIIAITAFAFYLFLQFYFQKRLPLVRIAISILLLFYIAHATNQSIYSKRSYLVLAIVLIFASLLVIPKDFINATLSRFFASGTATETISSNSRYLILNNAVNHTLSSPRTFLFGEGTGGCTTGDFVEKHIEVNGEIVDGLQEFEIGWASYFFEYGVVFLLLFYSFLFMCIFRFNSYKKDPLALACWAQVSIVTIFSIIGESFPNVSTPLSLVLLASPLGYLSSRHQSQKK